VAVVGRREETGGERGGFFRPGGGGDKGVDDMLHSTEEVRRGDVEVGLVDRLGGKTLGRDERPAEEVGLEGAPRGTGGSHAPRLFAEGSLLAGGVSSSEGDPKEPELAVLCGAEQAVAAGLVVGEGLPVQGGRYRAVEVLEFGLGRRLGRAPGGVEGGEGWAHCGGELVRLEHWGPEVVSESSRGRGCAARGEAEGRETAAGLQAGQIGREDLPGDVPERAAEGPPLLEAHVLDGEGGGEVAIDADGGGGAVEEKADPSNDAGLPQPEALHGVDQAGAVDRVIGLGEV
jgi:hypothetical protein